MNDRDAALNVLYANAEDLSDEDVYIIKIPVSEHGRPECVEAKAAEAANLLNFGTYEEISSLCSLISSILGHMRL